MVIFAAAKACCGPLSEELGLRKECMAVTARIGLCSQHGQHALKDFQLVRYGAKARASSGLACLKRLKDDSNPYNKQYSLESKGYMA